MRTSIAAVVALSMIVGGCGDSATDTNTNTNANSDQPGCGNGVVEGLEECDDGEGNSDTVPDACRSDCTSPGCGDGVTDAGEACDDGQLNSDTEPNTCRAGCAAPTCGDGVIDTAYAEICDDGADNSDTAPDACRADCRPASCGDGIVDTGEVCDDGNTAGGDGCSQHCDSDETCGNGVLDAAVGEACDEGAANSDEPDTPSCRTDCSLRRCGDGVVDAGHGEGCDDGGASAGDGCGASCQVEPRWTCQGAPSTCQCDAYYHGADCSQCVVHVDPNPAITTRDGTSWATALGSIQAGIDQAAALSGPCEVWVVQGTHAIWAGSPTNTLSLASDVAVYGGFLGTESQRSERSWQDNVTVLDGGASAKVLHVVTADTVQNATLDGFTIRDGYAQGPDADGRGGGMLTTNATVTVRNCVFTANFATGGWMPAWDPALGGAMFNSGSQVTITNTRFQQNYAQVMAVFDPMSTGIEAVARGGAVANVASTVTMTDATFLQNQATAANGGSFYTNTTPAKIRASGGAIYSEGTSLTVEHSHFYWNTAMATCECTPHMVGYDCGDVAGGAIDHSGADLVVSRTWLDSNSALYNAASCVDWIGNPPLAGNGSVYGGGLRTSATSCDLQNTLFTDNQVEHLGGGDPLYWSSEVQGGGVQAATACSLINCTLFGNLLNPPGLFKPDWGGSALWASDPGAAGTTVANSIIWNGQDGIQGLLPIITDSAVEGHPGGPGIIVDFPDLDFMTGRLLSTSACIDAADDAVAPTTDRDGNPRYDMPNVGSSIADMGAYEYQGP